MLAAVAAADMAGLAEITPARALAAVAAADMAVSGLAATEVYRARVIPRRRLAARALAAVAADIITAWAAV